MNKKYSFKRYIHKGRWVSYWHQVSSVLELEPKSVLVVGPGDGIVVDVLKKQIGKVKTFDIEKELNPDIVGSVNNIPLPDNSFDVVLCAEVLEHLPFEKFEKCLSELRRVAGKYVVLSLPHFGPQIKLNFKIPMIKEVRIAVKIPLPLKHNSGGAHYWEIGKRGYPPKKIRAMIEKYFTIVDEFIPLENQYHHFFVLKNRIIKNSLCQNI